MFPRFNASDGVLEAHSPEKLLVGVANVDREVAAQLTVLYIAAHERPHAPNSLCCGGIEIRKLESFVVPDQFAVGADVKVKQWHNAPQVPGGSALCLSAADAREVVGDRGKTL
jgi:hypothetical protein